MKKLDKKTKRIIAMALVVAVISVLLIRPRTIYSMAVTAIEDARYEAAYSLLERTEDERAEDLREKLCFAPNRSETVYADGTVVVNKYIYDDNSVLLRTETSDPRLGDNLLVENYEYDEFGWMLSSKQTQDGSDLLNTTQCTYDANGNLLTSVVSDATGELYRNRYTYDFEGRRLTSRTDYATGEWTQMAYIYNELGQVINEKKTDSIPEECYEYSYEYYEGEEGLLKTRTLILPTETIVTTFDEEGVTLSKVTTYTDGTVQVGTYIYDDEGLLDKVEFDDGALVDFDYDEKGNQIQRVETLPTGEKYVTQQEYTKNKVTKRTVDDNGENRYTYIYTYGKRNLCTYREYQNETTGMWYRLTFTYDRFGNLLTEVYEAEEGSYTRTIEWEIRYSAHGTPVSIQNSAKACKPTKEVDEATMQLQQQQAQ